MAVTRGFRGREPDGGEPRDRVPPGQYVTQNFPVLTAGPTQQTRVDGDPWREQRYDGDT